jgi:hypothetical protein
MPEKTEYPDDWGPEEIKQYEANVSLVLAGLDQVRSALNIGMREISWPRMKELAQRIIAITYDVNVFETMLVGNYLSSAARSQVMQAERAAAGELLTEDEVKDIKPGDFA